MAMKYFCCYHSYREILAGLTDEQFGKLFRAALLYSETGEMPVLPPAESIAFSFIRRDIDQASEEYERKCETNRANANRRKQTQATASDGIRPQAMASDGKPDGATEAKAKAKEKAKENANVVYDDREKTPSAVAAEQEEMIFGAYNESCPSLKKADKLTGKRREAIRELLGTYTPDEIVEGFRRAQNTPFLCGGGENGWIANFDWLMQEEHFTRLIEGGYDERQKSAAYSPDKYDVGEDFMSMVREDEQQIWH